MKNKGCLAALILGIGIAAYFGYAITIGLTPRDLSKEDPKRVFESFICAPIPPSVVVTHASGILAFAGGNAFIEFNLAPETLNELLHKGSFESANDRSPQWVREFKPDGENPLILRYVRANQGMTETALFISHDRSRAWFREVHY